MSALPGHGATLGSGRTSRTAAPADQRRAGQSAAAGRAPPATEADADTDADGGARARRCAASAAEKEAHLHRPRRRRLRPRRRRRGHHRPRLRPAGARHVQSGAARHGGLPMRRALLIALGLAGCTQSGTGVELFIDAGSLSIDRLQIIASYDTRDVTHTVGVTATSTLDVIAQLPDESTTVT